MQLESFNEESGCVYFVGCDEIALVKIGKTSLGQLKSRIVQLQIGSPAKLRLLGVKPSHNPKQEEILHAQFSKDRVRGEWFRVTVSIQDYIKRECVPDWTPAQSRNRFANFASLTPARFRELRTLAGHKQESLAAALGCSRATIKNYERGRTRRFYTVRWEDLARELRLDQAA